MLFATEDSMFVHPSHPGLSLSSEEIAAEKICSQEVSDLIQRMLDIAAGERIGTGRVMVGLAAPQIGVFKRVILVDIGANANRDLGELKAFINPKIVWKSEEKEEGREGCYSVDCRLCGIVPRSSKIRIVAHDEKGNLIQEEISGFPARVFQHEVDHLEGIRFPDVIARDGGRLQWVEEADWPEYRKNWQEWPKLVSVETWHEMKAGKDVAK